VTAFNVATGLIVSAGFLILFMEPPLWVLLTLGALAWGLLVWSYHHRLDR